jgi:hypothetical protein
MDAPAIKRMVTALAELETLLTECREAIPAERRAEFDVKAEGVRRIGRRLAGVGEMETEAQSGEWIGLGEFCKREGILAGTAANAIQRGTFPADQLRITDRGKYEVPANCAWRPNARGWKAGRRRKGTEDKTEGAAGKEEEKGVRD